MADLWRVRLPLEGSGTESGLRTAAEREEWWAENGADQLRQLFYWRWDPLGINDAFPATHGEYDLYVDWLREPMVSEADDEIEASAIDVLLRAQNYMGQDDKPGAKQERRSLAGFLVAWRIRSIWQWREFPERYRRSSPRA